MPEYYMTFARKINKMPEFYMILGYKWDQQLLVHKAVDFHDSVECLSQWCLKQKQ